jgi:hypothetical protein
MANDDTRAKVNADREIWRGPDEGNGDYYADSVHVTASGAIGINCGGLVIVRPLREWHRLAAVQAQPVSPAPLHKMSCLSMKGSRLNGDPFPCDCPASEAQSVSARPDVEAMAARLRFVARPTWPDSQADINIACHEAAKMLEALARVPASVSPLRDETREPDTAGRVELEGLERWDDVQVFPDDPNAPPYAEMRRDPTGRWVAYTSLLAALQRARESAQGKTR